MSERSASPAEAPALDSLVGDTSIVKMASAAAPVCADTAASGAVRQSAQAMDEVVVSGTLRAVRKSESPIAVETYSKEFFRKNPTPNLFEGLSIANGLQPQIACNVCNTGDIHINGMEGPYTMVLIDGMPIVSSLSTIYGLMGIPTSLIQRVEVVKGPASTLYGSDAVAGLINIITKDPKGAPRFSADIFGTTQQEINADFGAKAKLGNASTLLGINGYWYDTPHDQNGDGFTDVTQQRRVSVFNKWSFGRRGGMPASLAARLFAEERWGGQLAWNRSLRGSDGVYGESILTKRAELFGTYGMDIGGERVLLEYSYNYHHQDSWYGATPYFARQHTAFAQARWEKTLGNHNLLAGLPIRFLRYDDNTPATATADGAVNAPATTYLPGAFVQDEWKVSRAWTTLLGMRYEHHNVQGSILSPRLALKWAPSRYQIFRFSGGNGFRVVNLATEDHLALSGARALVIAEELRPEKSWNGSVNYTGTYTPGFGSAVLDLSAFYTRFSNKIVPDYNTNPQQIIYQNLVGYGVSKGVSANLDLSVRNGLKALLGATLMDVYTMQEDGERAITRQTQLFAPRWQATWAVSYGLRESGLTFDLTGKVYGPQRLPVVPDDYRPEYSPVFALANFQATKKFARSIEVYAAVKNLLNFFPPDPILHADDPFDRPGGKHFDEGGVARPDTNPRGYTFDPSYNYAPLQGLKALLGLRYTMK